MLRLPLPLVLAATLVSSSLAGFLPDTGLSVRAHRFEFAATQGLQVRLQNPSRSAAPDLEMRLYFTGDAADLADLAFRMDLGFRQRSDGYTSVDSVRSLDSAIRRSRTSPMVAGCTKNCQVVLALPLVGMALGPLESFRMDLMADKALRDGELLGTPPTHSLSTADWSLSGIPLVSSRETEAMERGDGPLATRIQVFSQGRLLWGSAPGEPERRFPSPWRPAGLTTPFDPIRVPFADSVSQRARDSANMKLSHLLVNQAGYRASDVKEGLAWIQAIRPASLTFSVINALGSTLGGGSLAMKSPAVSGKIVARGSHWAGTMHGGDSAYRFESESRYGPLYHGRLPASLPAGGPYRIVAGSDTSMPFRVDDRVYGWVRDAGLRFLGAQRSGDAASWMHGPSHLADPAPGGWYDCGGHVKEGTTQAYALAVLGALAAAHPERDPDHTGFNHDSTRLVDGVPDILRELKHGTDFLVGSWLANGRQVDRTTTTVGDFAKDLSGWFPADWSEALPVVRGGLGSRTGSVDPGANVQASFAAGLAFFAQAWKSRDAKAASEALELAKAFYQSAKADPTRPNTSRNYPSAISAYGSLALAATALLVATGDTTYLKDLAYDTLLGKPSLSDSTRFQGGWLGNRNLYLAELDLDNPSTLALALFHRLVLRDGATASKLGIPSDRERRLLQLRTALAMGRALSNAGGSGHGFIEVPGHPYQPNRISFDTLWYTLPLRPGSSWFWNTYQVESIASLLLYAEIAADLEREGLPSPTAGIGWNSAGVRGIAIRGLDGLLGVNPWDLSMVYGIGAKNPNHPHHRTSNPEGRTLPFPYTYQPPVGAVHQGVDPSTYVLTDAFAQYRETEPCLEGSASLLVPAVLLSPPEESTSGIGQGRARPATGTRFSVRTTRRGVRIEWSGARGTVEAEVVDLSGRRWNLFASADAQGARDVALPASTGVRLLRIRDAGRTDVLVLPPIGSSKRP